jgi:exopolysaccharide production protein ExoZ
MTLIFFGHFETLFRQYLPANAFSLRIIDCLGVMGHQGVCFFLTLSGYFVYRAYFENQGDLAAFIVRRVRRIYPPYLAMLGVYVVLSVLCPPESKIPSGPESAILYLAGNVLMISSRPLITVSWTIGTLMALYTAVPFFWRSIHLERWNAACRIGLIVLTGAIWFAVPRHLPMLDSRVGFVLVGFALYEALRAGGGMFTSRGEVPGFAILACGYVLWYALDNGRLSFLPSTARFVFLAPGLFYSCGHVIACRGRFTRWLERAPLPQLGRIGYSYYLCHGLTLKLAIVGLQALRPGAWHSVIMFWIALPVLYACTLVAGWNWFRFVEVPLTAAVEALSIPARLNIAAASPSIPAPTNL